MRGTLAEEQPGSILEVADPANFVWEWDRHILGRSIPLLDLKHFADVLSYPGWRFLDTGINTHRHKRLQQFINRRPVVVGLCQRVNHLCGARRLFVECHVDETAGDKSQRFIGVPLESLMARRKQRVDQSQTADRLSSRLQLLNDFIDQSAPNRISTQVIRAAWLHGLD